METLGSRIKSARKAAKLTQQSVADHFEINRVNITQWEGDTTRPDGYRIPQLAKFLGVDEGWLRDGIGDGPSEDGPRPPSKPKKDTFTPDIIPGSDLISSETMPLYAAARGGSGHVIVTFEEIDRVKRPEMLRRVKGGYGLLITGDSMIPAFRPGETALVHPHLPPMRDTDVILYHVPPHNEAEAMIKHLIGFNDQEWTLEQYNPFQQFKEYRQEWQVCHRVVGKYHAR